MKKEEIQNIVELTIENFNNSNNIVLNEKEVLKIKDNLSTLMVGLFGLKAGMQNNINMVNLLDGFERKCQEIFEVLEKKGQT